MRIEWTGADGTVRHGDVWSPGPMEGSVWVIPDEPRDGEGRAVCVGLDGRQTSLQARWSTQEHQTLVGINLATPVPWPDMTKRGGQLRANLTPTSSREDRSA